MAIFELTPNRIIAVEQTTFGAAHVRERDDLQRLLRENIEVIAPDLLVIAEEFGEWEDSRRRIDLLAVDQEANLVVIELKRSDDGGHMELQAIRYAAMVSAMTFEQAVEHYTEFLNQLGRDEDDARSLLMKFLGWDEVDEERFAQDVRIVLVSADFSKELTSAVLWLLNHDVDIRCVRLRPYNLDNRILIDVQQIIPLPEAADFQVQVREKARKERQSRSAGPDFTRYDVHIGEEFHREQWKRNALYLVCKHLCRQGVAPEDIAKLIDWRTRVWYVLEGLLSSQQFKAAAGPDFKASRGIAERMN